MNRIKIGIMGLVVSLISNLKLVNAADFYATLDLFSLLVEGVFGNLTLTFVGLLLIIAFIGFMSKMSPFTLFFLMITFTATYASGSVGALAAIPIFVGSMIYFITNLRSFIGSMR